MSSSSSVFLDIARWVFSLRHKSPAWQGKGLCKIDFAQNKYILSCTQIFLCKYKQGLAKNQKTSGLWNKLELIHSCLPIQIALYTSLAVLQHGQSSKYLSVVRIAKTCWVKVASQGGSLAKHASLSVANLTLNLLRSTWSSFLVVQSTQVSWRHLIYIS